ncbi:MAG: AAA family ATPase [Acidobacteriota bacterium]
MKCPNCRFDNPAGMKFCVECGTKIAVQCAQCGAEMAPSYKFCGACGHALSTVGVPAAASPAVSAGARVEAPMDPAATPAATVSSEGERKQVTVVFCDLITPATENLSPDVLHTLLSRFSEAARSEVEQYGGTINRFLGQGFMALFGASIAHEDHPSRAMLAAVGLRSRMRSESSDLESRYGVVWDVRMGVDTGPVVVGGPGDMAVGEATQNAALLQEKAAVGEILVSAATARLARGQVALEAGDPITGPGGRSVEVWQATGSAGLTSRDVFVGDESLSPFIGREHELSVLERLRDQAAEGQGQVVGMVGDAGSGKSRLLHEFFRRTFRSGRVSYLRGQCASFASGVPYRPLVDMIRKASGIAEDDASDVVRRKLSASLDAVGTDQEETLPYLLRLLGVTEGTEALDDFEPQAIQARTFAAMRRMLLDAGRRSLVVVEIEDLHWIDDTSAEFLDSLIEAMVAAKMLVLLTYRSGFQPKWLEKSYTTQIPMRRLSEADSRSLVSSLLQRAELPENLSDEILEKAEGNPLFLEEMARALVDGAGDADGVAVPDTVQGILMARIDRLSEPHKALLRTASVLGRESSLELLQDLWDRDDAMDPLLDDLQRWELLYKSPSEDRVVYFFKQTLTQDVTYQSLLEGHRRELHARAAHSLEKRWADRLKDVYDRLIYHYPRAGEPEKTVHYLTLFAHDAAEAYAHAEAAKALREALTHAEDLPETTRDRRAIELLLQLAESLLPLASFPETLERFLEQRERMEALDDPTLAGPFHFWLAHTYTYMGFQDETREFAQYSIDQARAAEDETTEGKARYVLGRDGFWSGRFGDGIENSLRAVVLLERAGEPWWQGQAYWVAGFNHFALGQFEPAIDALERALALGEALDDYRLDTSWSIGYFYASLGEAEMGIERCRTGVAVSQDPLNSTVALGFLGYALLQQGDELDEAVETLQRARGIMAEVGMQQIEGWFSVFLAEAHLARGETEAAHEAAEAGLTAADGSKFLYGAGLAREMLGRVALAAGELAGARSDLEAARSRFEELEMPFGVARADLELALLARAEDDGEAVERYRAKALEGFNELGLPRWIERAEAA